MNAIFHMIVGAKQPVPLDESDIDSPVCYLARSFDDVPRIRQQVFAVDVCDFLAKWTSIAFSSFIIPTPKLKKFMQIQNSSSAPVKFRYSFPGTRV